VLLRQLERLPVLERRPVWLLLAWLLLAWLLQV
jgi:hypothetical protein